MSSIALIIFGLIIRVIAEVFMFGHDLFGFIIIITTGNRSNIHGQVHWTGTGSISATSQQAGRSQLAPY